MSHRSHHIALFACVPIFASSMLCAEVPIDTAVEVESDSYEDRRRKGNARYLGVGDVGSSPVSTASSIGKGSERTARIVDAADSALPPMPETPPATPQPLLASARPYPTARLTGFFHADVGWFRQDALNRLAVGDIQDGAAFRRARLAAIGDAWENVRYFLEMDFAFPGRPSFMDVWLEMHELDRLGNLRVGQFRHPIGMDGLTSVKELTFLERALPFAFLPFRQIGLMAHDMWANESATWAVSAFRYPSDTFGGNVGDDGGYGLATRWTWLLVDDPQSDRLLHIGTAFSMADPASDVVRYRSQPEFFVAEIGGAGLVPVGVPTAVPFFVDTGPMAAARFNLFTVEAATVVGSLHLQSELMYAVVDQIGGPTSVFPGAYVQVGYVLTGEKRPYNRRNGVLGRIVPNRPFSRAGGAGAWELAARWSFIDLNNENIAGGRLNDLTFGINWYLNRFTKFQLNYIHAFLSTPGVGESDAGIVALRAQVDF